MTGCYLDASAILPTFIKEPGSQAVDRFLSGPHDQLIVGDFAAAEVASAFSRLQRTGVLRAEDVATRLGYFDDWRASMTSDLDLQASDVRLANVFVRRFDLMLRTPDALHAAICRRADLMLVTLDRRLASSAEALGVRTLLLA